jgi:hypothetical protein
VLVSAAHLVPETARRIADSVRPNATDPGFGLPVLEADAILSGDAVGFAEAADAYAASEMPYQEARCRLEAGQIERVTEIIRRFGLEAGPLGARLREVTAGST